MPGPPEYPWYAHPAFPCRSFAVFQRTGAAAVVVVDQPWTIVTAKEHHRVLSQVFFPKCVENLANTPV